MKFFNKVVSICKVSEPELFNEINGRAAEKAILKRAIYASNPVHVLLVGEPGTGKTIFLKSIMKKFARRAIYADFTNVSKAGVLLDIAATRPQIVCADEIEKASKDVRSGMLNIMEDGTLTRTLKNESIKITGLRTWVIATCNHIDKLRKLQPEFLDRMLVINVSAYTEQEYVDTAVFRLKRDNIDAVLAEYIARSVLATSGKMNLRQCVRIGSMAKTREDVDELLQSLEGVS